MSGSARRSLDADVPHRRERAAIAAQACQTCRTRKSKCDEKRPKCGLCRRLDVDCLYREPLPTKKDKTMVHILESLVRLETKFDNISVTFPSTPSAARQSAQGPSSAVTSIAAFDRSEQQVITDAHAVLTWPTVYVHLISTGVPAASDLPDILQRGSAWFRHLQMSTQINVPDPNIALQAVMNLAHDGDASLSVTFPYLTIQQSQIYAEAYFHTFNVVLPILEQDAFLNDVATPVLRQGYRNGDAASIIALLVYALGQLAMEGTLDDPITTSANSHSGIRGGTAEEPPGLATFNEARKRMGLSCGGFSTQDVQMRLLAAAYLDAAGLHMESWRATTAASSCCELLIRNASVDWKSTEGQTLKRLFWICYLNELMCHSYLGTPPANLLHMHDMVPLLTKLESHTNAGARSFEEDRKERQYFFPAMLSLEQLIIDIHKSVLAPISQQTRTTAGMTGPSMPVLHEIARQLDSWRSLLPRALHWLDDEMFDFPSNELGMKRLSGPMFSVDQGTVPIRHRYNLDITTAHLRSRFYLARHLLYQPFLYKVLHFSELLTKEDIECASLALQSALMWPILMAPPKDKKRLVPYSVSWTQTCISMLLIFNMTRVHDQLRDLCEEHVDATQVKNTIALLLDWLRDVQVIDPVAAWGWRLLEPLFADDSRTSTSSMEP